MTARDRGDILGRGKNKATLVSGSEGGNPLQRHNASDLLQPPNLPREVTVHAVLQVPVAVGPEAGSLAVSLPRSARLSTKWACR